MRHLDEGTIHAWLDGATSAEESRTIEAHIAECEACAELVAEARGLVAGASRILTALDHVPAGVIPAGAPAAHVPSAAAAPARSSARGPVRRWASRPGLRAAAAVLLLAGASVVVIKGAGESILAPARAPDAEMFDQPPAEMPSASTARSTPSPAPEAARTGATDASAQADAAAESRAAPGEQETTSPRRSEQPQLLSGAASPGAGRRVESPDTARTLQAKVPGMRLVPPPPAAPRAEVPRIPVADSLGRAGGVVAGAPAIEAARRLDSAQFAQRAREVAGLRRADSISGDTGWQRTVRMEAERRSAFLADTVALQRVPPGLQQQGITITGRAEQARVPALGVEMAGCYAVTVGDWIGRADLVPPVVPSLLRLDTSLLEIARDGPRLALRAATDTARVRADSSWWRNSARDSVLVVWRGAAPDVLLRLQVRDTVLVGTAHQGEGTAPVTAIRIAASCDDVTRRDER